jgi:purine-binding chemotaxis protein CheW
MAADGRMLLLVNPKELLTRAEQDVVAALRDAAPAAAYS